MNKETGHRSSTKTTFMMTAGIVSILLFVALVIFSNKNIQRITAQNREYLLDNAKEMAENLDKTLSDGYANIRVLSSLFGQTLKSPEVDISGIQGMIANSVFDFMEFADTDGMDHNITGGVSDAKDRQYFLDAREGNVGMELIYKSRATHETLLMFYSPVYYEGEFAGSLVGVYQAANLITKLLTTEYFGEPAVSYLLNENGRIVASSEHFEPGTEMYAEDLVGDIGDLRKEVRLCMKEKHTVSFPLTGNETGAVMLPLKESGWYLFQIFPEAASRRMIQEANLAGFVLAAFMLVLYAAVLIGVIIFYRSQQRQVETANNAKTSFLFNMSHDIRTPMNAITGFTAMAKKYINDPEKTREYLDKIEISGQQLLQLINQVLEMSRIESGKVELELKPIDIRERHKGIVTVLSEQANMKGITFRHAIRNIEHPHILCDESRMAQVAMNIAGNALKYTPEGGTVDYELEEIPCNREGYAGFKLIIRDDGIGMSPEYLEKLFEPFSRESTSTVSKIQGTGLGMSIVKSLIDIMGGTIRVSSEPGKGSTFEVICDFPIAAADDYSDPYDISPDQEVSFAGRRVLLVEDNEMNREIARDILEENGLSVDEAVDGDQAVSMMRDLLEHREYAYYDFILMDIQMPRMNGYEATRAIRELPWPKDIRIPIIAMTANAFEEDKQDALQAGMDAHLSKPIDIRALFNTLARYLS